MRTGVCHQSSNRILAAANVTIPLTSDPQVAAMWLTWSTYGRNKRWVPGHCRWPERMLLCTKKGASADVGSFESTQLSGGIPSSMTRTIPHEPDPRTELSSLIQATLGHPVDGSKFAALIALREDLQDRIDQLSDDLMEREISPQAYLELLDQTLIQASHRGEEILGSSDFHKVFGELRVNKLGDAKLFLEQYYKGH
jgi:hypothetical protein